MQSVNRKARVLCTVDDICLRDYLDKKLGFDTHKSGVVPVALCSGPDKQLLKFQKEKYEESLGPRSRFVYQKCNRYPRDEDFGVKVVATKTIYMDNLIHELYGTMTPVTEDFISTQIKDYSVVKSTTTGESKLWLGPAAFLNHDCEANTDIYCLGNTGAIVKANKKIKCGEEITVYYGPHYFGMNNEHCMCHTCEYKGIGHYQVNEECAGRIMSISEEVNREEVNREEVCSGEDSDDEVTDPREDVYTCNICGQIFIYKCWLGRHIASHMDPIHICNHCDRVFNRKDTLNRHIRTVHEKVKHSCEICDAKFSTTHAKTRHIKRIHSEENTSVHCPKCALTFPCPLDLKYHDNLKHTHLKSYKCNECNQEFETPYLLHVHKKSHDRRRNDQ